MQRSAHQTQADASARREQSRRFLLAEMGIQCLFARRRLPGAGPSHRQIFLPGPVAAVDTKRSETELAPSAERSYNREDGLLKTRQILQASAMDESATPPAVSLPETEDRRQTEMATEPAVTQSGVSEQEPFAFSWFTLDYRLAVLVMLPEGQTRLSVGGRDMLQKILVALSADYRHQPLDEHSFHWPLPDDLGLPADREAARHTVRGFIARRMREQAVANVLVFSGQLPFFLNGGGADPADQLFSDEQFGFSVLCTHALHSMQQQPALKRSAWSAMQTLIPRL